MPVVTRSPWPKLRVVEPVRTPRPTCSGAGTAGAAAAAGARLVARRVAYLGEIEPFLREFLELAPASGAKFRALEHHCLVVVARKHRFVIRKLAGENSRN